MSARITDADRAAAHAWPRFRVKREPRGEDEVDRIWFFCEACGEFSIVDAETSLCHLCWRAAVLGRPTP